MLNDIVNIEQSWYLIIDIKSKIKLEIVIDLHDCISIHTMMRRYSAIWYLFFGKYNVHKNVTVIVFRRYDTFLYTQLCVTSSFSKHHYIYEIYRDVFPVFALPNTITCFTPNIYNHRKSFSFTAILLLSSWSDKLPYSCCNTQRGGRVF